MKNADNNLTRNSRLHKDHKRRKLVLQIAEISALLVGVVGGQRKR